MATLFMVFGTSRGLSPHRKTEVSIYLCVQLSAQFTTNLPYKEKCKNASHPITPTTPLPLSLLYSGRAMYYNYFFSLEIFRNFYILFIIFIMKIYLNSLSQKPDNLLLLKIQYFGWDSNL